MNSKKIVAAVALMAVVLVMGAGTSQGKIGSGKLFPRLAQFMENRGGSDNMTLPDGRPPRGPHGSPLVRCINKMDLASDTQSSIDELVQAHRDAKRTDFEANKTLRDTYGAALTASPLDEAALAGAQEAVLAGMQADRKSTFALDQSIVALLTADELAELATCMANDEPPAHREH